MLTTTRLTRVKAQLTWHDVAPLRDMRQHGPWRLDESVRRGPVVAMAGVPVLCACAERVTSPTVSDSPRYKNTNRTHSRGWEATLRHGAWMSPRGHAGFSER